MSKLVKKLFVLSVCMLVLVAGRLSADEVLHNSDIIAMLEAKLNLKLLTQKILQSESNFDITSDALVELRQKEVPDDIIKVMLDVTDRSRHQRQVEINMQIQNLTSQREETRQMAYLSLLRMGGPAKIRMIEELTETRSSRLRAALATAIGRMGLVDSVQMVQVLFDDPEHEVRMAAAEAMFKLDENRCKEMVGRAMKTWWVDRPHNPREGLIRLSALLMRDQDSDTMGRVLVESPEWVEREQAAEYFTRIKAPEQRKRLEQSVEIDSNDGVRKAAALALGNIGDPLSVRVLKRTFAVDKDIRPSIINALEKFSEKDAVPALITFFSVKDITEKEEVLVSQALQRLTRQNFGVEQARWLVWWEKTEQARAIEEFKRTK